MSFGFLLALSLATSPFVDGTLTRPTTSSPTLTNLSLSEISTPRFRIVHTPKARGTAEYLSRDIEDIRDQLVQKLGRDWPGITEIRLGFGKEEYEALALPGGQPPPWAIALAYPAHNIVLGEAHALLEADGPLTLRHEIIHVALGQISTQWPRWFQEGLAQSLTGERQWRLEHVATLTRAVTQGRVFFFDDLTADFPRSIDDVEIAYAQSVAFVDFLRKRHSAATFGQLLTRMERGDSFEKSFGIAFGVPLAMEEARFREELPRHYPWWPLLLSGTVLWIVSSILVIVGWFRRRREVAVLRAEQLRIETLQEAASLVLQAPAVNDDAELEAIPDEIPTALQLWVVNVVFSYVATGRGAPNSQTKHFKAPG